LKLVFKSFIMLTLLVFFFACGPTKKVETQPQAPEPPRIEELRKPVAKDPGMFKVTRVIQKFGRKSGKYMSYDKFKQLTKGQSNPTIIPDWFYDSFVLEMNEKGYWATVTFGSAKRAIKRDPRIEKLLGELPHQAISIKLKTPSSITYLLTDAQADGILDYVQDTRKKPEKEIDIKLLDRMQEKYTWLIGIIKKYYKK